MTLGFGENFSINKGLAKQIGISQDEVDEYNSKVEKYQQITDDIEMKCSDYPFPVISKDASILDEILIHIKQEDLTSEHKEFAVRLIFRLMKKFGYEHIELPAVYDE